jgi:hypothetical protein
MCFPATAALEKLTRTLPEDRESKRIRILEEPSSPLFGLDTFDVRCLNQIADAVENDGQSSTLSSLGFPRIEWSSIYAEQDHCYRSQSLLAMDSSQSPININEDAHFILDRFFGGDTSSTVKDMPSSPGNSTTRLSSRAQALSSSALSAFNNNTTNKHGRLVRSIALGSRLALLEHPLTSSSINAIVVP